MNNYLGIRNPQSCNNCYKCVQNCFTKAIKIEKDNVTRDEDRCVNCGYCTKSCNMDIHYLNNHFSEIEDLLKKGKKVYVILDCIYQSEFKNITYNQMKAALKKIGFSDVVERFEGFAIYNYILKKHFLDTKKTTVSTFCTPFVTYVQKFHPDLLEFLAPIESPENICSRLIKEKHGEDVYTVCISTCFSSTTKVNKYSCDYMILVPELKTIFEKFNINIHDIEDNLEKRVIYKTDIHDIEDSIDSIDDCNDMVEFLSNGGKFDKIITPYWCRGHCYGTPVLTNQLNVFERKTLYSNYKKENCTTVILNEENIKIFGDLSRFYKTIEPLPIKEQKFSEDKINDMLNSIGRSEKSEQFDCGACGYNTCRENAIAMLQGMSTQNHCIPYVSKIYEESAENMHNIYKELDEAFALTIPNSRLVYKLKHTKEYKDIYIKETGKIKIVGVIEDGGFRHVVNALKVAADLHSKGVMSVIGLDKDILVKTIIFHDIGKSQPSLKVGDIVNPKDVFENGKMHAERSAELSFANYKDIGINEDIYTLIKYHHHFEYELPKDFPEHLLPMYRLFRIIDGMSAGLTRRGSIVVFELKGSVLYIKEDSQHPKYRQFYSIDLYKPEYLKKEYDYMDTVDSILYTEKYKK